VTGIAALLCSHYPKVSTAEVKDIFMQSVTKVNHPVNLNLTRNGKKTSVDFKALCIGGGIVNADAALKLATEYRK